MTFPTTLDPAQGVWLGLFALSLAFVLIGRGLREEKVFRLLGAALLVLLLMVGIDIWILLPSDLSDVREARFLDAWQAAFHVLACAFMALLLRLMRTLTGRPGGRAESAHFAALLGWTLLAAADGAAPALLFTGLRDGAWRATPLYTFAFMPHLVGLMVWITWMSFARGRGAGAEARILGRLGFGFAWLFLGGSLDFLVLVLPGALPSASHSLLGALGFGVACIFLLTDRLADLFEERRRTVLETARVHGELGAAEPLRAIGRSAALVSDAIRADVAGLRREVSSLSDSAGKGTVPGTELARIERARGKLERLAAAILDYSRSGMAAPGLPTDPAALLRDCLRSRPEAEAGRIRLAVPSGVRTVVVDRPRLERAVRELLANALEAEAASVEVRIRQGLGRTVIAIEDDGRGYPGPLADIPKPFFTTRKRKGGLGLGAAIAAGSARGLGGSLRWYRRPGRAGLLAVLVLPDDPASPGPSARPACALVSADPERMEDFLAACGNLGVVPSLLGAAWTRGHPGKVIVDGEGAGAGALTEETLLGVLAGEGTP